MDRLRCTEGTAPGRRGGGQGAWPLALLLALALLLGLPTLGQAAQVDYRPDVPVTGPGTVTYVRDPAGRLDVRAVAAAPQRFLPVHSSTADFGFSNAVYWLHLPIRSRAAQPATVYLSINQATLGDVRLYVFAGGVLQLSERAGDELRSAQQQVSASHPVFALPIAPGVHYELYLRVSSHLGALVVPMQFQSAADLAAASRVSLVLNGAYTGVLIALVLYNLFLWAALRQTAYLWYVLALPPAYLAATILDGFGPWILYPGLTWPSNQGLVPFAGVGFVCSAMFARTLLCTSSIPWFDRLLRIVIAVAALSTLTPWLLPGGWSSPVTYALMSLVPPVLALAGILAARQGHPQARFFLLAQFSIWIALVWRALIIAGALPLTPLGWLGLPLGSSASALLLSLALADRIRELQRATRRAENATRRMLETRHVELERSVEERTRELDEARRHAEHLATTDALTGVYNRRGLLPNVQQAIASAAAASAPLSLISFDLDHFKRINDEFGHVEGDRVLCQLVHLTRQLVRASDLLGRVGGEEFMLMVNAPRDQAVQLAERLRIHLETHLAAGPHRRRVTASFGVVALDRRLSSLDALQLAADAALYRAKNRGRNRVETYDPTGTETTRSHAIMHAGAAPAGEPRAQVPPAA